MCMVWTYTHRLITHILYGAPHISTFLQCPLPTIQVQLQRESGNVKLTRLFSTTDNRSILQSWALAFLPGQECMGRLLIQTGQLLLGEVEQAGYRLTSTQHHSLTCYVDWKREYWSWYFTWTFLLPPSLPPSLSLFLLPLFLARVYVHHNNIIHVVGNFQGIQFLQISYYTVDVLRGHDI